MEDSKIFASQTIKRYYGESGVIDLLIGIIALLFSLGNYYELTFTVPILIVIMFGLNRYLRKIIIQPRLGFAEFSILKTNKRKRNKRIFILILAILIFSLYYILSHSEMIAVKDNTSMYLLCLIALITIGFAAYRIMVFHTYRLFIYCAVMLIIFVLGLVVKLNHTLFWGGLVMGFLGIIIGLPLIFRFIKRYPVLDKEDE
ncbi:MAG: hypothetical protein P9X26_05320 [Candidatus Stygibacter frigidus]|nr:hypothetical protein [Candidatus Stygibacter frigidus]